MAVLDRIRKENDIKELSAEELALLPEEIRAFLIEHVSKTGGHLASSLGAVELTIALHLVLDFPKDKLIWDVGHQSYAHKILTGRKEEFEHLRCFGGISGFPRRSESECDCFNTGHSSTSISAGLGFAQARDIQGEDYQVVSVIGDGALTGGMAYEALNNAADFKGNFIIVLNDNKMSISENVGGIARHLAALRTADAYQDFKSGVHSSLEKLPGGDRVEDRLRRTKSSIKQMLIPGMIFENMGLTYLGPVDGHNVDLLVRFLGEAKKVKGAVILHVLTEKGKGYPLAEQNPSRFHGIAPFDPETGQLLAPKQKPNYTDIFSTVMCKAAAKYPDIVAITAAMADGTGLRRFRAEFPDRFFDVGISEGHAVTFAAGLAAAGLRPVFAVYSSFLQRGFDQILHDVCIPNLPVVFAIDRAGLVGADGETHQGIFDLSYLSMLPNMTVMAPKNKWELADMLWFALRYKGPVAVRYPRGTAGDILKEFRSPIEYGKSEWICTRKGIAILAVGTMVETALAVRDLLYEKGYPCTVINARFVKPLDMEMLRTVVLDHQLIVTMEENVLHGGFGDLVGSALTNISPYRQILCFGIEDRFVPHGTVEEQRRLVGLDPQHVAERILKTVRKIPELSGEPKVKWIDVSKGGRRLPKDPVS